ncbi:MAG: YdcF family protein [Cyclobacteriaceae bacterium]
MFFFLSKTLSYVTMPLVIICILLLFFIFLKKSSKWKNRCLKISIGMLFFFTNDFINNEVARWWEIPATPIASIQKKYEYGILLTGVARSDMEPDDRIYLGRGGDRVTQTLQLYQLGIIKKILVSGGNGKLNEVKKQEADVLFDLLVIMGVPPSDILIENKSRNTHESAMEVNKLFRDQIKPTECVLITSAFHMRRSQACFAKQGLAMDGFSTDFISHKRKFTPDALFIPKEESMGNWHILVKEWTGLVAYKLMGYI